MTAAMQALAVLLPILYLVTGLLYWMDWGGPRAPKLRRWRMLAAWSTVLAHLAWELGFALSARQFPVSGPWTALSMLAFLLLQIYLVVEWRTGVTGAGGFVLTGAFVLQFLASAFGPMLPVPSVHSGSPYFLVHILTIMPATASLILSGFFGALYLVLYRQLRERQFGFLFSNLPDLESLSRLNRWSALAGFVFMTVGLNVGIWWGHAEKIEGFHYLDPKVLPAIVIWAVFGAIGLSQWIRGLTERRAAWIALVAGVVMALLLLISLLPLGSFHEFS